MNRTNILLLEPQDVLFFRDGRPMEGALAGNGAAWPMPSVINASLHAALHRSGLQGHAHDQQKGGARTLKDVRVFGSLVSEGPFPVRRNQDGSREWFFPRPVDLGEDTIEPSLLPVASDQVSNSNLPSPLESAVGNCLPPVKQSQAKPWIKGKAYQDYLNGKEYRLQASEICSDSEIFDTEAQVGIEIDPVSGTAGQGKAAGKIYSARYLRLRDHWNLGVFAKTHEKCEKLDERRDLITEMISDDGRILVGGQQRICTVTLGSGSNLPLPVGLSRDFFLDKGKRLVKWILLSPAVYPAIPERSNDGKPQLPHCGGWLPNWIRQSDGQVMLRSGKRMRRSYDNRHRRGFDSGGGEIHARLVSAIIPKPLVVTGWALANGVDRNTGGAKSSHLAVPAGAIYYFEAENEEHAGKLADALNWHGEEHESTSIRNRRSTLMGEKGFGLGVCGNWKFFGDRKG
jgi:CRISPR-associated protein Cmr3